jgi:hypothetical protein
MNARQLHRLTTSGVRQVVPGLERRNLRVGSITAPLSMKAAANRECGVDGLTYPLITAFLRLVRGLHDDRVIADCQI